MTIDYLHQKQDIICNKRGDCMSIALACILGVDKATVPKFLAEAYDAGDQSSWMRRIYKWLRENNIRYMCVPFNHIHDWRLIEGVLCECVVPSQMFPGGTHSVVCSWRELQHEDGVHHSEFYVVNDPNPNNAPYDLSVHKPSDCIFYFKPQDTCRIK